MNSTTERGRKIIGEAEHKLRSLLGEAAAAGDYASVMTLTEWATAIVGLITKRIERQNQATVETSMAGRVHQSSGQTPHRTRPSSNRRHVLKGEYPKFFRRKKDLVKVGWSRRAKAEYEHKVPESTVLLTARIIAKAGSSGELISTEKFLTTVASEDGSTVPEYQVYVVLAWLRAAELVTQHGRQGYTVSQSADLVSRVSSCWDQLPTG